MTENPKPIHTIRLGAIHAAIWANPGQHGTFYNVTIDRRFRDQDGNWKSSGSFGRDDLLLVAKIADIAHTIVCEKLQSDRAAENGTEHETQMADPEGTATPNVSAATRKRGSR